MEDNKDEFVPTDVPDDLIEIIDNEILKFVPPVSPGKYKPTRNPMTPEEAANLGINPKDVLSWADTGIKIIEGLQDGNIDSILGATGFDESQVGDVKRTIDILDAAYKIASKVKGSNPVGGGDGGSNGPDIIEVVKPPEYTGSSGSGHHPYRLDYNLTPTETLLNTGIRPNTYTPLYHDFVSDYSHGLHMTGARLMLPYTATEQLYKFFSNVISFILQNKLQSAVSFSISMSDLTPTKINTAFTALLNAIQVYYFYDSVLQYCNNPQNRNQGMISLRQTFTSDDINNLYEIRRLLAGLPIPPNMLTLAFYLNQNFVSGSTPGSSIIKMCPISFATTGAPVATTLSDVITALTDTTNRTIFTVMARACPNWINPSLPANSYNVIHDPNFTTIWRNLPYYHYSTSGPVTVRRPTASTSDTEIKYTSDTNNLDGGAYGLMTAYQGASLVPSLIEVVTSQITSVVSTNRFSFNGTTWDYVYDKPQLTSQRGETYWCQGVVGSNPTYDYATHRFGTEICKAVTPNTITQTAFQLLEWMFTFDSIKPKSERGKGNFKRRSKKK